MVKKAISMEDMCDINRPQAVAEYAEDIMKAMKLTENKYKAQPYYMKY
jgi:hypothetical protein